MFSLARIHQRKVSLRPETMKYSRGDVSSAQWGYKQKVRLDGSLHFEPFILRCVPISGHQRLVTSRSNDFKSGAYNYSGAAALINDIPANRDAKFPRNLVSGELIATPCSPPFDPISTNELIYRCPDANYSRQAVWSRDFFLFLLPISNAMDLQTTAIKINSNPRMLSIVTTPRNSLFSCILRDSGSWMMLIGGWFIYWNLICLCTCMIFAIVIGGRSNIPYC